MQRNALQVALKSGLFEGRLEQIGRKIFDNLEKGYKNESLVWGMSSLFSIQKNANLA